MLNFSDSVFLLQSITIIINEPFELKSLFIDLID